MIAAGQLHASPRVGALCVLQQRHAISTGVVTFLCLFQQRRGISTGLAGSVSPPQQCVVCCYSRDAASRALSTCVLCVTTKTWHRNQLVFCVPLEQLSSSPLVQPLALGLLSLLRLDLTHPFAVRRFCATLQLARLAFGTCSVTDDTNLITWWLAKHYRCCGTYPCPNSRAWASTLDSAAACQTQTLSVRSHTDRATLPPQQLPVLSAIRCSSRNPRSAAQVPIPGRNVRAY